MRTTHLALRLAVVSFASALSTAFGQVPGAGSESLYAPSTEAAPGTILFGGVRLWMNRYDAPTSQRLLLAREDHMLVLQDVIVNNTSKATVAPILFVGLKIDRIVGSASYLLKTVYDGDDPVLKVGEAGRIRCVPRIRDSALHGGVASVQKR